MLVFHEATVRKLDGNSSVARRYTPEHEWVEINNGIATMGITDYAQKALGDVVYIEVPEVGKEVSKKGSYNSYGENANGEKIKLEQWKVSRLQVTFMRQFQVKLSKPTRNWKETPHSSTRAPTLKVCSCTCCSSIRLAVQNQNCRR
jgi:hypothetical protein